MRSAEKNPHGFTPEEVMAHLDAALDRISLDAQPEIATRVLDLSQDPDAMPEDLAAVLQLDPTLTARLLGLANSALYGQRKEVTTLDRAIVVLGLGRVRSLALGYCYGEATASVTDQKVSRFVWGQSLFRACLGEAIAANIQPSLTGEAFVTGLLLDAGIPVLHAILGEPVQLILNLELSPHRALLSEEYFLPYTHVDVIAAMNRRWRLPSLLADPINQHHTPPAPGETVDSLRAIALVCGSISVNPSFPMSDSEVVTRDWPGLLQLDERAIDRVAASAAESYVAMTSMFGKFAETIADSSAVRSIAQRKLAAAFALLESELQDPATSKLLRIAVGDSTLELERDGKGRISVSLLEHGTHPIAHVFHMGEESDSPRVLTELGFEPNHDVVEALNAGLRSLAA